MRRLLVLGLVALALGAVLGACGGGHSGSTHAKKHSSSSGQHRKPRSSTPGY